MSVAIGFVLMMLLCYYYTKFEEMSAIIYLKALKLSNKKISDKNIYPYNVIKNKENEVFVFDTTTILYGNNGSEKSTLLNINAHKLNLKGKERTNPEIAGTLHYFEDYAKCCEYELGENENGKKISKLPENSRYIRKAFASQTYVQNRFAIFAQPKEA